MYTSKLVHCEPVLAPEQTVVLDTAGIHGVHQLGTLGRQA